MDNFEEIDDQLKTKKVGKKKEDTVIYSLDAPGTIEVLVDDERLVYLTDSLEITERIFVGESIYTPPPISSIPYLLANKNKVFANLDNYKSNPNHALELYEEVIAYHKNISDLPHEIYYDLLALWDFHTYFLDKLHFSPIIYLYAVKERGKSRTGKSSIFISRRGVWTETVREADIIRWGNDHKAALGFDVKDAPKKFERANCDDLILARFEAGSVSSRTLWPEKGPFRDTKTFNLFGPTIIATNRPVDDILESRSISIDMKPTARIFNDPVLPENALELKNKLTAFRIFHYKDQLRVVEKQAHGRFGDIISPLYQLVVTFFPSKLENFQRFLSVTSEKKQEDATESLEAKILEVVVRLEQDVSNGFLSVESITKAFNEEKEDRFKLTSEMIGRILRGLGFDKKRASGGTRGIYYDLELIKKLKLNYGLNDSSDRSDTDLDIPSVADKIVDASVPSDVSILAPHPSQLSQDNSKQVIYETETKVMASTKEWLSERQKATMEAISQEEKEKIDKFIEEYPA